MTGHSKNIDQTMKRKSDQATAVAASVSKRHHAMKHGSKERAVVSSESGSNNDTTEDSHESNQHEVATRETLAGESGLATETERGTSDTSSDYINTDSNTDSEGRFVLGMTTGVGKTHEAKDNPSEESSFSSLSGEGNQPTTTRTGVTVTQKSKKGRKEHEHSMKSSKRDKKKRKHKARNHVSESDGTGSADSVKYRVTQGDEVGRSDAPRQNTKKQKTSSSPEVKISSSSMSKIAANNSVMGASRATFACSSMTASITGKSETDTNAGDDSALRTIEGQLALNPWMTRDQAKSAAKREYNRQNAARARLRSKDMVKGLQEKVDELTKLASDLQRSNEILRSQLDILTTQNQGLMAGKQSSTTSTQQQAPGTQAHQPTTALNKFVGNASMNGLQTMQQSQQPQDVQLQPQSVPQPPVVGTNPFGNLLNGLLGVLPNQQQLQQQPPPQSQQLQQQPPPQNQQLQQQPPPQNQQLQYQPQQQQPQNQPPQNQQLQQQPPPQNQQLQYQPQQQQPQNQPPQNQQLQQQLPRSQQLQQQPPLLQQQQSTASGVLDELRKLLGVQQTNQALQVNTSGPTNHQFNTTVASAYTAQQPYQNETQNQAGNGDASQNNLQQLLTTLNSSQVNVQLVQTIPSASGQSDQNTNVQPHSFQQVQSNAQPVQQPQEVSTLPNAPQTLVQQQQPRFPPRERDNANTTAGGLSQEPNMQTLLQSISPQTIYSMLREQQGKGKSNGQ